jgi:parallel beta-helix repeat protein
MSRVVFSLLVLGVPGLLRAATITVTTTADAGPGSLRQAILDSNASAGTLDTIAFAIAGAGPHTIAVASPLPGINDPVVIDGTTQPGYAGAPLIEIDGTGAGGFQHGLTINAGGSTVRGLAINRCNGSAIQLFTGDGNTIEDNHLGTDVAGTAVPLPANGYGVNTNGSDGNVIQNNLISGNAIAGIFLFATGNSVRGNVVGTDLTGTAALPNGTGIQDGTGGNTIGGPLTLPASGPCAGDCNLVSGNNGVGINLSQAENPSIVQGNFVGTDVTGLAALGNGNYGIAVLNGNGHSVLSNVVSNNFLGIGMNAGPLVVIQGNFIGTDATGTLAMPNEYAGVAAGNVSNGSQIGGASGVVGGTACALPCNLISGNTGYGVAIGTGGSTIGEADDVIRGNCIGTQVDCETPLPNRLDGINLGLSPANTAIGGTGAGEGNVIAHNLGHGVLVGTGVQNHIRGNSIFQNQGLGIDLGGTGVTPNDSGDGDSGANQLQNFPIITSVEPALAPVRRAPRPGSRASSEAPRRPSSSWTSSPMIRAPTGPRSFSRAPSISDPATSRPTARASPRSTSRSRSKSLRTIPCRPRPPTPSGTHPSSRSGCPCRSSRPPEPRPEARTSPSAARTFWRARPSRSAASPPATSSFTIPTPSARPRRCWPRGRSTT